MDDLISRKDAIEAVEKESQVDGAYGYMDTKSIVDLLNDLPSVQPEQKTGRWEEKYIEDAEPFFRRRFYCSACGEWQTYGETDYCPNCGARMDMEME